MSKEMAEFGWGIEKSREYFAEYRGVTWRDRLIRAAQEHDVELPPPLWYQTTQGDCFELHEDNCFIFMSQGDDELDCVQVHHPDGGTINYWRDDFGDEKFEMVVSHLGNVATFIMRPTPAKGIIDYYEAEKLEDLRTTQFIPDDWE